MTILAVVSVLAFTPGHMGPCRLIGGVFPRYTMVGSNGLYRSCNSKIHSQLSFQDLSLSIQLYYSQVITYLYLFYTIYLQIMVRLKFKNRPTLFKKGQKKCISQKSFPHQEQSVSSQATYKRLPLEKHKLVININTQTIVTQVRNFILATSRVLCC